MPFKAICGIYRIECLASGNCYVGASSSIFRRWAVHRHQLQQGTHHSLWLQRAWRKYGPHQFNWTILERCDREQLADREQYWMDRSDVRNTGYNLALIAGSTKGLSPSAATREKLRMANLGKKASEETKAKMRAARKGKKPNLGRRHSDETRAKMRAAHVGKPVSFDARANMSVVRKGKRKTPEHRAKIAATLRGTKVPPEVIAKRIATRAANAAAR